MAQILLGLDIGTQTIKAVQISKEKRSKSLLAAGYVATPYRELTSNSVRDEQVIAEAINKLVHDMHITTTDVSASLPSYKVVTRVIEVPQMSDSEMDSSIQWEAEQYIALPLAKVKLDYCVISQNQTTKRMKILLVAAPISMVDKYIRIIKQAGLTPISLETEIIAAARCITESVPTLSNMIVFTMGATTSEVALIHDYSLIYTKSYPIGGSTLTRAIAEELGFELAQAEEYKKTYGLEEDKLEGKIVAILTPYFTNLFHEIEKTVVYYREQYSRNEISNIVIAGGGAKLPGLVSFVTKHLNLNSQVVNPFVNLSVNPSVLPVLIPDAPIYASSVGLALKDL